MKPVLLCLCLGACLSGLGCDIGVTPDADDDSGALASAVYIRSWKQLEPPDFGDTVAFAPTDWLVTGDESSSWKRVAEFYVDVSSSHVDSLKVRLSRSGSSGEVQLARLNDRPVVVESRGEDVGGDDEASCFDTGCFWIEEEEPEAGKFEQSLGLVIPESGLQNTPWLEVYVSETSTGAPLLGDRIRLTEGFFYLAAIGDSIVWGNGLREQDKFTSLVAEQIELETGLKVVRMVYAISGATIVPHEDSSVCEVPCNGEVPTGFTPITVQADLLEHPELLDLILMDGCANDVGLSMILSPETVEEELIEKTQHYCETEMIGLLEKVRGLAPDTPLVVSGYFPFISDESLEYGARELAIIQGFGPEALEEIEDPQAVMVVNSEVFDEQSRESLQAAVDTVNAQSDGDPMIAFAYAGYGPENAVFASQSWLWNLTVQPELEGVLGLDLRLVPEDPMLDVRIEECPASDVAPDLISCLYGSLAHPNPPGARAYAAAIIEKLRGLGVLPPE